MNSIYERITALCNANGTTITALCEELKGSKGNLSTWRKGNLKADDLLRIADKFCVSVDYLLGRSAQSDIIERPDYSISNDFAVNYEDIIKERAFNDLAKLYKAVDSSMRAQMLVVIATYLHRSGIDTESIVGY